MSRSDMSKSEMLDVVRRARELLARAWVAGTRHTDWSISSSEVPADYARGQHCHLGCLEVVQKIRPYGLNCDEDQTAVYLNAVARRLHPLVDTVVTGAHRFHPAVYVNNVLGRDAIVAVYDAAIEDLELAVLCEEEVLKESEEVLA